MSEKNKEVEEEVKENEESSQNNQSEKIEVVNKIEFNNLEKLLKDISKSIKYLKNENVEDEEDTTIYF